MRLLLDSFQLCLFLLLTEASSFVLQRSSSSSSTALQLEKYSSDGVSRQEMLRTLTGVLGAIALPKAARADVADGNQLPKGAEQFNRVLRLKKDLKGVKTRVSEKASELDKAEWNNLGQFLRLAYTTADQDMKAVGNGVYNPENKKRALEDVEQLKKYSQAGDVSVSKQDGPGLVAVVDKMSGLVEDFLDSLSDVPDL